MTPFYERVLQQPALLPYRRLKLGHVLVVLTGRSSEAQRALPGASAEPYLTRGSAVPVAAWEEGRQRSLHRLQESR